MRLRKALAALAMGQMVLMGGCPLGGLEDFGPFDYAIPDGTYGGKLELTASFWENGVDDGQDYDEWETTRIFKTGDLINKVTGDWFYPGDVDTLSYGSLEIERVVTEVEQFEWGYHVLFDVSGYWYDVPLSGSEDADYFIEPDGTLSVEDTIQLQSRWEYDGGTWEIDMYIQGNLTPIGAGGGGDGGGSGLPPWFDDKSG
ncbi:MAG: hypothetical protein SF069_06850 [Phycisphaerae bacterium]|nr:hypothetical protein [Phycisphaerae bacterium]